MNINDLVHKILSDQETEAPRQFDKLKPLIAEFALSFSEMESHLPRSEDIDKQDQAAAIERGLMGLDFVGNAAFHDMYWRPFLAWLMARDPAALDVTLKMLSAYDDAEY